MCIYIWSSIPFRRPVAGVPAGCQGGPGFLSCRPAATQGQAGKGTGKQPGAKQLGLQGEGGAPAGGGSLSRRGEQPGGGSPLPALGTAVALPASGRSSVFWGWSFLPLPGLARGRREPPLFMLR